MHGRGACACRRPLTRREDRAIKDRQTRIIVRVPLAREEVLDRWIEASGAKVVKELRPRKGHRIKVLTVDTDQIDTIRSAVPEATVEHDAPLKPE